MQIRRFDSAIASAKAGNLSLALHGVRAALEEIRANLAPSFSTFAMASALERSAAIAYGERLEAALVAELERTPPACPACGETSDAEAPEPFQTVQPFDAEIVGPEDRLFVCMRCSALFGSCSAAIGDRLVSPTSWFEGDEEEALGRGLVTPFDLVYRDRGGARRHGWYHVDTNTLVQVG